MSVVQTVLHLLTYSLHLLANSFLLSVYTSYTNADMQYRSNLIFRLIFPQKTPVDLFGLRGSKVLAFSSCTIDIFQHSFQPLVNQFFLRSSRGLFNFQTVPFTAVKGY